MSKINDFIKNKVTKSEKIYLLYCLFLIPLLFLNFNNLTITSVSRFFGILSLVSLLFGLYLWYKKINTLNSLPIYFILSGYICWYGEVLIRCFGFFPNKLIEIDNFEPTAFYKTCAFLTISFSFLFLGLILFARKSDVKNGLKNLTIKNEKLKKCMTFIAIIMILFSFVNHYYSLVSKLVKVFQDGYVSLYTNKIEHSSLYNIFSNIKMFFWPGIIILFFSNKENKPLVHIIFFLVFFDIVLLFLGGSRSAALTLLLLFFWIYSTCYKNIKIQNYVFLVIGGLLVAQLFNVIHDFRIMPDKSFSNFLLLFFNSKTNIILTAINEFGFNIFSLYHTMELIPSVSSFGFGYTYFAAIMAVIPSLLMGGFSFSTKAGLPDWLMTSLNMDYGPGYTIVAESFYNFGYFGFIMMFLIGLLIALTFNNNGSNDKKLIKACIIAILFYSNLFIVRDTFLFVFRNTFYLVIVPFLIIYILYKNYNTEDKYIKWIYLFVNKTSYLIDKMNISSKKVESKKVLLAYDKSYKKIIKEQKRYYKSNGYEVDEINEKLFSNCKNKFKIIFKIKKILHNNYCIVECYGQSLSNKVRFANTLNRNVLKIDYYNYDTNFKSNYLIEKYLSKFTNTIIVDSEEKMDKLNKYVLCEVINKEINK